MGFIKVRRHEDVMTIPESAFKQLFEPHGWIIDGEHETGFTFHGQDDDVEYEEVDEPDFDKMNVSRLKEYAAEYGIDINGLTTKAEIKQKIVDDLYE